MNIRIQSTVNMIFNKQSNMSSNISTSLYLYVPTEMSNITFLKLCKHINNLVEKDKPKVIVQIKNMNTNTQVMKYYVEKELDLTFSELQICQSYHCIQNSYNRDLRYSDGRYCPLQDVNNAVVHFFSTLDGESNVTWKDFMHLGYHKIILNVHTITEQDVNVNINTCYTQ